MPRFGGIASNPRRNQAQPSDARLHLGHQGDCFESTWGSSSQWKNTPPYRSQSLNLRRRRRQQHGSSSNHGSTTYQLPEPNWTQKPLPRLPSPHQLQSLQSSSRPPSTSPTSTYNRSLPTMSHAISQKESNSSRVSSVHSLVQGFKRINFWGGTSRQKMVPMPLERVRDRATQTYLTYSPDSPDPVIVDVKPRSERHHNRRHGFESDSRSPSRTPVWRQPRLDQPSRRTVVTRWSRGTLENSTSNSDLKVLHNWRQPNRAVTPSPDSAQLSNPPSQDSVGTYESRYSERGTTGNISTPPPRPSLQRKPASDSLLGHARQRALAFPRSPSPHTSSKGYSTPGDTGETAETPRSKAVAGAHCSRQSPGLGVQKYRRRDQGLSTDPIPLLLTPKASRAPQSNEGMRDEEVSELQRVFRRPLGGYFEDAVVESNIPDHFQTSPLCPLNPKHKFGGGNWCPLHGGPQPTTSEQAKASINRFLGPSTAPVGRAGMMQDDTMGFNEGWQEGLDEFKLQPRGWHPRNSPSCPNNPRYGGRGVCVYHGRGLHDRLPED